ncbi:DUF1800 domain-containing protein [Fischerella sp. JS2]|uniref:DUF1800 domain-containing protein n=1 Tax=Fischerella sp. JS2 TaxID=2597771 RepID=UPI0028ECB563|nr:DUF1800 domain-containing protein [Fischerella sp. JS2]
MIVKPKYLVVSLFILLGGIYPSDAVSTPPDPKILHVINRLSFGPRPGDVAKVKTLGIENYIKSQLSPDSIPEPQSLTNQLSQLETLNMSPVELYREYAPVFKAQQPAQQALHGKVRLVIQQAVQARLLRATQSPRQLQEVMVDFWYNHFNVYAGKGLDRLWIGVYEQEAIRPYVLGSFRDLLEATARHPAMLFYLDNWQNTAPGSPGARGRFQGINENYARELMELHTLGVDGGYTQQDVVALARILTGWGFRRDRQTSTGSGFYFDPKRHDFSDKVFLGHTIKGSGEAEVEQALDILARSPATAHHISYQLAQYFVSDRPPETLVKRLQERFLATNGNIREVLNTLFHSPEFWDTSNFNTKFKTPYQYVVSGIRATGIKVENFTPLANTLKQLGMPLYGCQTPDGYKNTQEAWLNPDAMTRRLNFATALASGRLRLAMPLNPTKNNQLSRNQPVDALQLANTLGNSFSKKTQTAIASSPPQLRAALILGSPEFMYR